MQSNFDPKLFDSLNEAKKAHKTQSERNVERGRPVEEQDEQRKKFDLDEQLGKKEKEGKKVGEDSILGLASTTRKREGRGGGGGPHDLVSEQARATAPKGKETPTTNQPFHIAIMQNQAEAELAQSTQKISKSVQEMIKLLVASIVEMKHADKTDTTLVIQHPPLFAGAKLTITTFESAKGEFNIMFSELTPQAKQMLDQSLARDALMKSLEERGYIVHIMITSTQKEETPLAFNQPKSSKEDQEKREGRGREGREEEEREEG